MSDDLENFYFQLDQVKLALASDPHNVELRQLQRDLEEVIELTASLHGGAAKGASSSAEPASGAAEDIRPALPPQVAGRAGGRSSSAGYQEDENDAEPSSSEGAGSSSALPASRGSSKPPPTATATADSRVKWKIGDVVAAKWAGNGKLYEATITAVSNKAAVSEADVLYSVVFAGYTSVELVKQGDIREFDARLVHPSKRTGPTSSATSAESRSVFADASKHAEKKPLLTAPIITAAPAGGSNAFAAAVAGNAAARSMYGGNGIPAVPLGEFDGDGSAAAAAAAAAAKKRKRDPAFKAAKLAKRQAKLEKVDSEHKKAQQSWLQFASGTSGKKKAGSLKPVAVLNKKSMFSTPDNPNAKVGVIGSGRGMTEFGDRNKHQFDQC